MSSRAVLLAPLAALVVVVALLVAGGRPYTVSVPLQNAAGLKDGSAVRVGGLDRGTVRIRIDDRDRVVADLELDDAVGPVGRDATVAIVAANFLGLKRVELDTGDAASDPAPDGYELKPTQVTTPTDLDQVLSVFDADTRTRAKVLLNEAGEAVVGRRVDVAKLLKELPVGMAQAGPVLEELATSDRIMHDLVERSDRFVAQAAADRRELTELIDVVGGTAETVAAKRGELRETLRRAPGTLRALRATLAELEATTADLGPAAREITAAAPDLAGTLAEVDGFRRAASPTLAKATAAAPDLTRLARGATPVLRTARGTAGSAATLAAALPPVTDTLDKSSANVIAVLENWARAIQFRDQLGHVFRGEASFSPDLILTMVDRLAGPRRRSQAKKPAPRKTPIAPLAPNAEAPAPPTKRPLLPKLPVLGDALDTPALDPTVDDVKKAMEGLIGGLSGTKRAPAGPSSTGDSGLLDFLLGP